MDSITDGQTDEISQATTVLSPNAGKRYKKWAISVCPKNFRVSDYAHGYFSRNF